MRFIVAQRRCARSLMYMYYLFLFVHGMIAKPICSASTRLWRHKKGLLYTHVMTISDDLYSTVVARGDALIPRLTTAAATLCPSLCYTAGGSSCTTVTAVVRCKRTDESASRTLSLRGTGLIGPRSVDHNTVSRTPRPIQASACPKDVPPDAMYRERKDIPKILDVPISGSLGEA